MKIVYMGTPEFSKVCLEGILENNYNVTRKFDTCKIKKYTLSIGNA